MIRKTGHNTFCLLAGCFLVVCLFVIVSLANAESVSMLDIGTIVNAKMKSLAAGVEQQYTAETSDIKAIRMADSLPAGFVPAEANTVSVPECEYPIYIFFDNIEDAGILYFYTEGSKIVMNPNSDMIFGLNAALEDISGLNGWDAFQVVQLRYSFMNNRMLTNLAPLANWDTSSVKLLDMAFLNTSALTDISALKGWNTSNVTSMYGLFSGARNLPDALALRKWDTSNVTNMSGMFSGASSLMYIDVSGWNTGKVTTMTSMFAVGSNYKGDGQLREIFGIGELDVSNVTDMTCMFYGAGQMTHYDVAGWDVSKVESMNHMFCDNFQLRFLDLSAWDVSSLKTVYCMFDDNKKLQTIGDVSHWNTKNLIDAGGWLNWSTSFVGNENGLLDLSGWDTNNLISVGEMFSYTKLHAVDLSGWTFDAVTNGKWEGAGKGIFYESGNGYEPVLGFGQMFYHMKYLDAVYVSQSSLDSFNAAVERGVNIVDMWTDSKIAEFTVK